MFSEVFVTITGMKFHTSSKGLRPGDTVLCVKDKGNLYDDEAIAVFTDEKEQVGYIANSSHTVAKGTYSAGRLYDRFTTLAVGVVCFIVKEEAIVKVVHLGQRDEGLFAEEERDDSISSITTKH